MMKSFVQFNKGRTPRQAHRDLDGLKDDELGRQGFQGRQAQLYRQHDPTAYRIAKGIRTSMDCTSAETPDHAGADGGARRLLVNADCAVWLSRRVAPMPFHRRNGDADEVWFVHTGTGTVETEFGPLAYEPGDYVVLPKGITHRVVPADTSTLMLGLETFGELTVPDYGPMGRHTPYDPTLITVPEPQVLESDRDEYEVRVRIDGDEIPIFYKHNPCDVEGWKGDYFPFVFNIRDWNVVMSDSLHLVPSMHVFLEAPGVNLIHFLPRPFEGVEGAERLPYYHRNADYDEVAFFHGGSLFGNPLPAGRLEHNPQGLHHGPPELAREIARQTFKPVDRIEWQIISIDTRRRLRPSS